MTSGDKEILAHFEKTRNKTIELLKRVPPGLLGRKPNGEDAPVAELFHHIAACVDGWMFRCMVDGGKPPPAFKASRPALIRAMQNSRARLLKFFKARGGARMNGVFHRTFDGRKYRFIGRDRVHYLTGHESHHRGKIVLALRQWGFTDVPFLPY